VDTTSSSHALILDMDTERSGAIAELLRERGYPATPMQGVGAALAVCARVPFTVIVLGDVPEDHDRGAVCRALRQSSNSAILALVTSTAPAAVTPLLDAGASDVVVFSKDDADRLLLRVLVTERRAAAQSHAEAMLRAMPDLAFRIHASGEFISFHANNVRELLTPPDKIVGRSISDLMPPDVARLCLDGIRRALDSGELQIITYTLNLQGSQDYEARLVPAGPDEVLAVVRNITDRTQAQSLGRDNVRLAAEVAERRRAEEALRDSEAQWRSLVENCPDLVVVIDASGRISFTNRPVDTAGLRAEVGRTVLELAPPHLQDVLRSALDRVFSRGEPTTLELAGAGDLSHVAWELRAAPIRDDGPVTRAVVIARDITERRAAEVERARMQERLWTAQKLDSLGLLAGGVAHDFNNLLTAILGSASVALLKLPPGGPARSAIETLVIAARRASELTQQLLAYSGRGKLEVRPLDLTEQIRELLLVLHAAIPKQIELHLRLGSDLPSVLADVAQMRQIVMNLVINAAEAIGERTGTITITTSRKMVDETYLASLPEGESLTVGEHVALEVHDDGCGMDVDTVSKVFDPFFSTKATGRGLGLAAVQGIVRSHRGALRIHSRKGRGTSFKILLPASEAAVESRPSEPAPPQKAGGTVLVVDDEALLRRAAKQIIEHFGYDAVEAEDGRAAIAIFRERARDFDVVLLDMTMPGLTGEETFQELLRIRPDARVVLSSGFNEMEATRRFSTGQLAGFLQKPYTAEQLAQMLSKVVGPGA
jgi:PAS domain S-box-containing protein